MFHKEKLEQLFAPANFAHKAKVRANDKYVRDTLDVTNTAAEDANYIGRYSTPPLASNTSTVTILRSAA